MDTFISMLLEQCSTWKKEVYPKLKAKDIFVANNLGPRDGPRLLGDQSWNQSVGSILKNGNFPKTKDRLPIVWICIGTIEDYEDQPQLPATDNDAGNTYNIRQKRSKSTKPVKQEPVAKKGKKIKQEPKDEPLPVC